MAEKLQEQYPTPMLQGWAFLMGGIMFSLIFRPWQIDYVPTAMGVFGIFIVVVLGNVLAFSLYMSGVPLIGPQKASLYSFAEPVTAAIISTLVLGSPLRCGMRWASAVSFDAGAAEPARKTEKLNILRNTPAQV
ncbi:DMT family transporter [Gemmiger formicilis]|nr:DMT family transporter [Gemmiger formicilis]